MLLIFWLQIKWLYSHLVDDYRGIAGDYAVGEWGRQGIEAQRIHNQYFNDPSLSLRLARSQAISDVWADAANQIELQALPNANVNLGNALVDRANVTRGHLNEPKLLGLRIQGRGGWLIYRCCRIVLARRGLGFISRIRLFWRVRPF